MRCPMMSLTLCQPEGNFKDDLGTTNSVAVDPGAYVFPPGTQLGCHFPERNLLTELFGPRITQSPLFKPLLPHRVTLTIPFAIVAPLARAKIVPVPTMEMPESARLAQPRPMPTACSPCEVRESLQRVLSPDQSVRTPETATSVPWAATAIPPTTPMPVSAVQNANTQPAAAQRDGRWHLEGPGGVYADIGKTEFSHGEPPVPKSPRDGTGALRAFPGCGRGPWPR